MGGVRHGGRRRGRDWGGRGGEREGEAGGWTSWTSGWLGWPHRAGGRARFLNCWPLSSIGRAPSPSPPLRPAQPSLALRPSSLRPSHRCRPAPSSPARARSSAARPSAAEVSPFILPGRDRQALATLPPSLAPSDRPPSPVHFLLRSSARRRAEFGIARCRRAAQADQGGRHGNGAAVLHRGAL